MIKFPITQLFRPASVTVAMGLALAFAQASANAQTITDQNSSAHINFSTQAGMDSWTVDGINQLNKQWFWYRIGTTGPEHSINTISAPTVTSTGPRQLTGNYSTNNFNLRVDYLISGGAPLSGSSALNESITINNTTSNTLDFHFFQYSDFNLGGLSLGDSVALGTDIHGKYNEADQSKGPLIFSESVLSPGADRGEANVTPVTLNSLNDSGPTTLNNVNTAGPGDVTWAFEWDLSIAAGGSAIISKDKHIDIVPEPSCLALGALGLGFLALRRRLA
jgi:hypothetical protein